MSAIGWRFPAVFMPLAILVLPCLPGVVLAAAASPPADGDQAITALLEPIRAKYGLPALCAAVLTSKEPAVIGAVGVRKAGTEIPATIDDKWHLGSNTKAMTASLAGLLVEEGLLRWELTIGETFPELASDMNSDLKKATLRQLLSHRAGLPANIDWRRISEKGSLREQRYNVVKTACSQKPLAKPGRKFAYSNLGYVIAGAMIERVTSASWETEMQKRLFAPLGMASVGYGGAGTPGKIDQPWSHLAGGKPLPANGPDVDNPLVMAPAGCAHCTMADWALFIADQLRGARGEKGLLRPDTYRVLQTPVNGGDYALGWLAVKRDWAGGMALAHQGSNTMNYANAWLAPARDFAVLVCANQGGDEAFQAADEAVGALIGYWLGRK